MYLTKDIRNGEQNQEICSDQSGQVKLGLGCCISGRMNQYLAVGMGPVSLPVPADRIPASQSVPAPRAGGWAWCKGRLVNRVRP